MHITGAHHVALYTANFERLRAFYSGTLGLREVGRFAGHRIVFLGASGTTIELEEVEPALAVGGGRGWNHLALEVADIDAAYAELTTRGVPFEGPPAGFPGNAPAVRTAFFRDPDGNLVELVWPLPRRG